MIRRFLLFALLIWTSFLSAAATISGTVTNSSGGSPISGATLVLIRGGGTIVDTTTTALNGTYTFVGVNPGQYTVRASATSFQTAAVGAQARNNQTTVVDFALVPDPGTISGQVTDSGTSLPINGATVQAFIGGTLIATTTTNAGGNYSLTGLAPGSYAVTASASTYQSAAQGAIVQSDQTATLNFALLSNPGAVSGTVTDSGTLLPISGAIVEINVNDAVIYSTTTNGAGQYSITGVAPGSYVMHAHAANYQTGIQGVAIQAGVTSTVDFALVSNPGTIAGTVTAADTGLPIASAVVEVNLDNTVIFSVLTDDTGTYSITGVPPGSYIMHAHASGYQTGIVGAIVQAGQTTTVDFSLQSNPGAVSGTVTDADTSLPIAGATVEVNLNNVVIYSTLTDPSGNYSITGVPPGSYIMHAHATDYQTGIVGAIVVADQTTTVNFALESNPGTISGTVTDANTTLPISGATVEVNLNNVVIYSAVTNAAGEYSITGVPPGSYIMHAHAASYQIGIVGATVQAGLTTTVNFALESNPGTVAGTVTDASTGLPIPGTTVEVNQDNMIINSTQTDAAGNYTITGISPGTYVMHAHAANYQTGIVGATVQAGQTTTVNFALLSGPGSVAGTVTDANTGLGISGALVEVNFNNLPLYTAYTNDSGNYSITGVPPGAYVVHGHAAGYQIGIQNATVIADQTTTVNLALQTEFGTLSGTVTDADTTLPISGATVEVNSGDVIIISTLTSGAGTYSMTGIAPGSYVIHAHAATYQIGINNATITASLTTISNFALESSPSTVQGQITNILTGDPIGGAFVQIFQGGSLVTAGVTDGSGNYVLVGLSADSYTITASATGYYSKSEDFSLNASETKTINIALTPDSPPQGLTGQVIKNEFALQTDRIHRIAWTASQDPTVVSYLVYRNGALLATILPGQPLVYNDHNRSKNVADTYTVYDINSAGNQSSSASITLR